MFRSELQRELVSAPREIEFQDRELSTRVDALVEEWVDVRTKMGEGIFDQDVKQGRENKENKVKYLEEYKKSLQREITRKGRVVWLVNNFHGHFPGGMHRMVCEELAQMSEEATEEGMCVCGKPYIEFYKEFDGVVQDLELDPNECNVIGTGGESSIRKNPEIVAQVFVALLDKGYTIKDLWT